MVTIFGENMSKKQALLAVAQEKVRAGGYANFSFRELADIVGIKSASVHYHFPTKADLGAELAKQYTQQFLDTLGSPNDILARNEDPIVTYIDLFRTSLLRDKKMCLCGLLGAESDALPDKVKYETKRFFERNIEWLEQAFFAKNIKDEAKPKAIELLARLEGAMLMSKTLGDLEVFDLAFQQGSG